VEKDVKAAVAALDEPDTRVHEDHISDRTASSLSSWSKSLVQGAMSGWSDPDAQAKFRKQTADLASSTVNGAVDGALAGLSNPERIDELKSRLRALVEGVLGAAANSLSAQVTPAIRTASAGAMKGIADGIESNLGPALEKTLRDHIAVGLADGLREKVGPAVQDVLDSDVIAVLNQKLTPALADLVTRVGQAGNAQVKQAELDAAANAKKVAYSIAVVLGIVALGIGFVAWQLSRRAKLHLDTIKLLTSAIKRHQHSPDVKDLVNSIRAQGLGTPEGNNLDEFLSHNSTLRVELPAMSTPPMAA
jgi:hypothetical protein